MCHWNTCFFGLFLTSVSNLFLTSTIDNTMKTEERCNYKKIKNSGPERKGHKRSRRTNFPLIKWIKKSMQLTIIEVVSASRYLLDKIRARIEKLMTLVVTNTWFWRFLRRYKFWYLFADSLTELHTYVSMHVYKNAVLIAGSYWFRASRDSFAISGSRREKPQNLTLNWLLRCNLN